MSFEAGSLEDVEAWANHEFPAYFAEVIRTGTSTPFNMLDFDGEYVDAKVVLQPMLVSVLEVGTTTSDQTVYARVCGNNDVELFSGHEIESLTDARKLLRYMKPIVDLADINLNAPFSYPVKIGHPAGVDRLETLIRYLYLKNGEDTAVQPKLGFFKMHFRAACHDVARGTGAVVEAGDMDDSDTLFGDSPPDLIADTDIAGLRDNPAATSIFNQHVHAMDESYHDFKTSMLRQFGAMQTVDRNHMAQLQAQVQDLEHRLAVAEEGQMKLGKELEGEKTKAKTASDEAARWKAQYEGLRGTLQANMPRSQPQQHMSLGSVTAWASAHFRDDYLKIPKRKDYTTYLICLPKQHSNKSSLTAIIVGTAFEEIRPYFGATVDVLAWVKDDRVEVGYITQLGNKTNVVVYEDIISSRISFQEPFCWILDAADETAIRRFEALVHHAAMLMGSKKAINSNYYDEFRDHFPGACRDIAEVAEKRIDKWRRITAPLESNEHAASTSLLNGAANDTTMGVGERHQPSPSSSQPVTIDLTDASSTTNVVAPSLEQSKISPSTAATTQGNEISKARATLTTKMNITMRLHAREKEQLQKKIRDLKKALAESIERVANAEEEAKKAQDKTKEAQEKAERARLRMSKAQVQVEKAEAETARVREEAKKEIEKAQSEAATLRTQHSATAKVHVQDELKLRIEIQHTSTTITSGTMKATQDTAKTHEELNKEQQEIARLRGHQTNAKSQANTAEAFNLAHEIRPREKQQLQTLIWDMEKQSARETCLISRLREDLTKAQKDNKAAREQARGWEAKFTSTFAARVEAQNQAVFWHGQYDTMVGKLETMRQVAEAWEARYHMVKALMKEMPALQLQGGEQLGGQMEGLIGAQDDTQDGGQGANQVEYQATQIEEHGGQEGWMEQLMSAAQVD
ncbi:hypothetical protein BU25DRAFT_418775 [Macroventuria anomochaeta]|uniref:Uncharacterized protein n=1 Tax=Macroventuria anomochaeta TaxID=301207 RepID=A0ACB6SD18_9PLEO|nr:uncharacterized protein BU25DRAFT_418775 [Macroventuria anomochaeta]KAF2631149.1 hypothetical protein BU25DRAFT_418775 [Macroventuria anomochaeta]